MTLVDEVVGEDDSSGGVMKIVKKDWGEELWIANNELYCGKKITNNGKWSSKGKFHYHPIKDETFYVLKGKLRIDIALEQNGWINTSILSEGMKFRIKPTIKHRFKSLTKTCEFMEFSTTHKEEDSIRCFWNKEEEKWVDVKS